MAICHRSWCAEHPGGASNERLEFLGDAVLGAVVAEELYTRFPDADEGWLSRARATVVRASTLAEAAEELGLGQEIRLGKGEEATGGREKPSILADGVEALIGAVHLDAGREASHQVVLTLLGDRIAHGVRRPGPPDDKSRLQEHVSQELRDVVVYRTSDSGPEHDKTFVATVSVGGRTPRHRHRPDQEAGRAARRRGASFEALEPGGSTPHLITPADPVPAPSSKDEDA